MDFISVLFYAWLSYWLFRLSSFIWYMVKCHILTKFGFHDNLKKYGEWAVITGATDGIGKCYALELANRKFNIVLISRTEEKLKNVANEIEEAYGVKVKYMVFDFSKPDGYDTIDDQLKDLDVGVLVNNVGMSSSKWNRLYDELDITEHIKVLHTNTFGEINMTYMVLKGMLERKRGVIIHVSSIFGYCPLGLMSVYAPTKAFVNSFVANMQAETKNCPDIHHQLVTPFFVVTNMTRAQVKETMIIPEASYFVSAAVRTIGITSHTFGCWAHDFLGSFIMTCPQFIFNRLKFCKIYSKECHRRRMDTIQKQKTG